MTSKEEARVRKLLQAASPAERVVPIILKAGIANQIDELEQQLIRIRSVNDSLSDSPEALQIAEQIEALIEEVKESTIRVTIRQLPRKRWSDLKAEYPPSDPRLYYYSPKIFNDAVPESWVAPDISDDTRDGILETISDGQWNKLCDAVQVVNGDVAVPFSELATRVRRAFDASKQQPGPTE